MSSRLPDCLRELLWDVESAGVSWERDREFLIDRALSDGSWEAIRLVRREAGDDAIREAIRRTRGRRLAPPQIRFWQLILDLPEDEVARWLTDPARAVWDRRCA